MIHPPSCSKLIDVVPPPEAIRDRIGESLREVRILRQLLKVSENVARQAAPDHSREVVANAH